MKALNDKYQDLVGKGDAFYDRLSKAGKIITDRIDRHLNGGGVGVYGNDWGAKNTSFLTRQLEVRLTLQKGQFADGSNTKVINQLAINCTVDKLGFPEMGKASVEIVGMTLEDMEKLSTLAFHPMMIARNYINIFAGDKQRGMNQIFAGTITKAGADFNAQPNVKFKIEAQVGFFGRVLAQGQNVISGKQKAATFIEGQCKKAGFSFINQGNTSSLENCVFSGSPMEQAQQAAKQIGAEIVFDDDQAILLAPDGNRDGMKKGSMFLLNKDTGLLGYPTISQNGVELRTIFNPAFKFASCFELQSTVPKTSGIWRITKLTHKLSANDPKNGTWESAITGFYPAMSGAVGRYV